MNNFYALNELDKKLLKYLDYDNGYFVELGANNGVNQSNTLHFELEKNWSGVLIEPTPHNYLECCKNRRPENHIFCNATKLFCLLCSVAISNDTIESTNLETLSRL